MTRPPARPSTSIDLFTDAALSDPYPLHATLRQLGPAVRLEQLGDVWAIPRYADVKAALADPARFSSSKVALNDTANGTILAGTVLASDGADHARLRRVLSHQLARRALSDLHEVIRQCADQLVAEVVQRGRFDAVSDLAIPFVGQIITYLAGLPARDRDQLVAWAEGTFSAFGPETPRTQSAFPLAQAMFDYLATSATRERVRPGSWLAEVYAAADRGEIGEDECIPLASAYTVAGADTTIHAITTLLGLLARHPRQWQSLRRRAHDPAFLGAAVREALRYDAPVQWFCRTVTQDTDISGVPLTAGSQVLILYGSANRDRAFWGSTADQFRVRRRGTEQHLALGHGPHSCAGTHLAHMEITAVLGALAHASPTLRLVPSAPPCRQLNNTLRGWASLPLTTTPAR
ncbi:cytochrome P450 [Streptomyces sp. DSM 41524]|uniref:Cytochrome P450 n=1 Tax=Streptomyces asiaticus subsp. ignotus TaxID=3098222 RepID=A0ABU7Q8B0_9ACTN|nr:cytochrome P450 [Streptomyces sp. DSM 41524]